MSPNGRRAWREWVRRQDLRRKHKQPKGSVCRMARQARRHIPLVPGAVLPKPPTTRSLVGMTMGARKRAAWYEALRTSYDGDGGPISNRKLRLCVSVLTAEVLAVTVPIEWRLEVRAKYRIGERLRPCPGCIRCNCSTGFAAWPELGKALIIGTECDGSGVLPARRSK